MDKNKLGSSLFMHPVGHKKCATLLWTITSALLNGFQQLMHQWKKE